eukprot:CAMPEP_0205824114 /NCGR_PEP_ID=MMETSP0206-20130828/19500_1 /ASSEMBLY_ACC=CAM_ASM_000279 /TAXON_ID=36767 /ORGANISM="Euplotes focardii, Strain TN1" /LENGTH=254 /DNA_ID=CAMNT_0053121921 /DNA_START=30 /DNA_END=794 /DNA_ORIENTATION=+
MSHKCRRFENKVALVTASSAGIGLAIAKRFAEEGAHVLISSRKQKNVDAALVELQEQGLKVDGMVCHVGKADHRQALVKAAADKYGRIDILVSNAAVQPLAGPALDAPDSIWDKIMDVNVRSHWQLCKDAKPFMHAGSNILFVSSIAAFNPQAPLGLYGVSKTALLGLTRCLASELGPEGIRVNCLAPGTIKTKFSQMLWKNEAAKAHVEQQTYLGRVGEVEEMAGAAAFICSMDGSYMTGETVVAAGGMPSRL